MVGWHHPLNGHEFEKALGVGDGQGSLLCCDPWGHKELDTTERMNNSMVFPIVGYSCESQAMKKAECRRIYAFEL